ncbi:uncharacterized protein LOC144444493 isoform X2 [Glandiceps talaboti]
MTSLRSNFDFLISPDNNNRKTLSSRNLCIVPPEYLNDSNKPVHNSYDIYSFGIVLWELVCGKEHCANTQTSDDFVSMVSEGYRPNLNDLPEDCPPLLAAIMEECWDENPRNRPSFEEILQRIQLDYHQFYESKIDDAMTEVRQKLESHSLDDGTSVHRDYHSTLVKGDDDGSKADMNYNDCVKDEVLLYTEDELPLHTDDHQENQSPTNASPVEVDKSRLCMHNDTIPADLVLDPAEVDKSYTRNNAIESEFTDNEIFYDISDNAPSMSKTVSKADLYQMLEGLLALEETDDIDLKPSRRRTKSAHTYLTSPTTTKFGDITPTGDLNDGVVSPKDSSTVTFKDDVIPSKGKKSLRKFLSFDESKGQRSKYKRGSKKSSFWGNNHSLPRTHSECNFEKKEGEWGTGALNRPLSLSGENISLSSSTSASMPNLASSLSSVCSYEPELIAKVACVSSSRLEVRIPRGVTVSSTGVVYLCDSGNRRLQALSTRFQNDWKYPPDTASSRLTKKPQFDPRDATLTNDEQSILVSDFSSDSVLEISLATSEVAKQYQSTRMRGPWGLTQNREGTIYVVCNKSNCILVLKEGEVAKEIGQYGSGLCQFKGPTYLSIDSRGNLIVADCKNFRVQVLSSDGDFIRSVRDKQKLPSISGIAVDEYSNIYVADEKLCYIWVYDEEGTLKTRIKRCHGDKKLVKPQGVAVTSDGEVVVVDKLCVRLFSCVQF